MGQQVLNVIDVLLDEPLSKLPKLKPAALTVNLGREKSFGTVSDLRLQSSPFESSFHLGGSPSGENLFRSQLYSTVGCFLQNSHCYDAGWFATPLFEERLESGLQWREALLLSRAEGSKKLKRSRRLGFCWGKR
jgi:hypothetical protein